MTLKYLALFYRFLSSTMRKTNSEKSKETENTARFSATTKKKLKKTFKMLLEEEGFKRDRQGKG